MKQTMKTTLYLPEQLHVDVKIEAAKLRTSMTQLIIQSIECHQALKIRHLEAGQMPPLVGNQKILHLVCTVKASSD
jgi:hypothetical protein